MASMTAGEHYYSTEPGTRSREGVVEVTVAGRPLRLRTDAGVFSAGRLDPGTGVLLRKAELPTETVEGALLDLGCGYGPIACTLALLAPRATVYAVDVNGRALLTHMGKYQGRIAGAVIGALAEGREVGGPRYRDLADNGRVVFGPAARPLPQLPLALDDEGYLVATSDFTEPVGPSFWERG